MKHILVTGARGFIGRNLCAVLRRNEVLALKELDKDDPPEALAEALAQAGVVFHLAGINRPQDPVEFESGNAGLLERMCGMLREMHCTPKIVLTSSIQADLDNPYGASKRHAEEILKAFAADTGAECVAYRLKNLFGKWCRPNYNSVAATFCHNIAKGLPIQISDRSNAIELTHIDDVVSAFADELHPKQGGFRFAEPLPSTRVTLGELADQLYFYKRMRDTLYIPDLNSGFERALYGTYLSYLNEDDFAYGLNIKSDPRGSLAEFLKSPGMGQIFVSRTKPGVTRGDHYHHTKTEKFLVLQGKAVVRFRHIESDRILEYVVNGEEYKVLDIPPGYTHSIENVGEDELVTLFWASEIFDPGRPDTYYEPVKGAVQA